MTQQESDKFGDTISMLQAQITSKELYIRHLKDSLAKNIEQVEKKILESEETNLRTQKIIDVLQLANTECDIKQTISQALSLCSNIYT